MPRIPLLSPEAISEQTTGTLVGHATNLHRILGYNPRLLEAWKSFAATLRDAPTSSRALRELITLRVGQVGTSDYMWVEHVPMALAAGVTERQIAELGEWSTSSAFSAEEKVALRMAEAVTSGNLTEKDFLDLAEHFPPEQIVELTFTASFQKVLPKP